MTPEERNLVIELFDRLATLEDAQRDPEAERLIRDGLRQAPNALYALVQTVLVQDEALKRADARIRELESASAAEAAPRDQSFLGGVRESVLGKREGRGVIGGSLLLSGIRSMMGQSPGAHAAFDPASGASGSSPWGGGAAGGELARQAGLDDVGRASSSGDDTRSRGHGLLDDGRSEDMQDDQDADDLDDDDFDDGGDGGNDL